MYHDAMDEDEIDWRSAAMAFGIILRQREPFWAPEVFLGEFAGELGLVPESFRAHGWAVANLIVMAE